MGFYGHETIKKKKLLFIVEAMGGGVFTYMVDLANELVNLLDVYIAYAVRSQTPYDYQSFFDNRIHLIKVENFSRTIDLTKDIKAFFELRAIARKIAPDIIHLHSSKAGVLGRWAFNGEKVPLFYTPHGYSFLMTDCGRMKKWIFRTIEVISAKRCCITISCSEGEHQETLKFTKNAVYVNNGINQLELDRLLFEIEVKEHPFTVFTLGRICYQKNPVLFNKIAEALPDVRFLWIGDGELKEQLTASNIQVTGWMDRYSALVKAMNSDVFILTSLWEGLPMSLLESMHMKKACIVSDVIGNHDVIKNGVNGFVCSTVSQFSNAIRTCRPGDRNDLIDCAWNDIALQYNTKTMSENYLKIYRGGGI